MSRLQIAMLAFLALLFPSFGPLRAQERVRVPDNPVCPDCLELEVMLSFGFADDEGALHTRIPAITLLPDGRWVVFEPTVGGTIRTYNSDGSFRRAWETDGEGPGEYRGLSRILPNEPDGFVLYDITNARLSYVDEDFSFLSSNAFFQAIRIEALSGGSFVVNATMPRTAAHGHVVNVVDFLGRVQASFGGKGRPIDFREGPHVRHRVIAVDQSNDIWTGYMEKYELEKFSSDGRLLLHISRIADWFIPHSNTLPPRDVNSDPPNAKLRELTLDNDGLIWTVVFVADPDWKAAAPDEFDPYANLANDDVYDSIVEVIDPASGRVLGRARSDFMLRKVNIVGPKFGAPLYFRTIQLDDGFIQADVLRAVYK